MRTVIITMREYAVVFVSMKSVSVMFNIDADDTDM